MKTFPIFSGIIKFPFTLLQFFFLKRTIIFINNKINEIIHLESILTYSIILGFSFLNPSYIVINALNNFP